MMPVTDAQRAALLASARTWSFRFDVLHKTLDDVIFRDVAVVGTPTISNNDLATNVKRTCKITLAETTLFDQLTQRLRAWALLADGAGGWHEFPLGTFFLSTATRRKAHAAGDGGQQLDGYDGLVVLLDDKIVDRYVVATATAYTTAVSTVLTSAGFDPTYVSASSKTLPAPMEWDPGTSKLKIVNDLLAAINYEPLKMDALGRPVTREYVQPSLSGVTWSYAPDAASVMTPGVDSVLDLFSVPNTWVAFVSQPDRPTLRSVYVNSNPSSATSTVSRGRTITSIVENQQAADQATLDAIVARAAAAGGQLYEEVIFNTGLMPIHESGDVLSVDYGDGPLVYREHSWELPCVAGGLMKHVVRRVVTL